MVSQNQAFNDASKVIYPERQTRLPFNEMLNGRHRRRVLEKFLPSSESEEDRFDMIIVEERSGQVLGSRPECHGQQERPPWPNRCYGCNRSLLAHFLLQCLTIHPTMEMRVCQFSIRFNFVMKREIPWSFARSQSPLAVRNVQSFPFAL